MNCDGIVKIDDAVLLSRYVAEDTTVNVTQQGIVNGDCDGASGVNANDTSAILMYLAGLLAKLG